MEKSQQHKHQKICRACHSTMPSKAYTCASCGKDHSRIGKVLRYASIASVILLVASLFDLARSSGGFINSVFPQKVNFIATTCGCSTRHLCANVYNLDDTILEPDSAQLLKVNSSNVKEELRIKFPVNASYVTTPNSEKRYQLNFLNRKTNCGSKCEFDYQITFRDLSKKKNPKTIELRCTVTGVSN